MFTHNGIGMVNVFSRGVYFITRQNKIMKAPPELDIVDKGNYTYFFEDREGWIWVSNAGKGLIHFRIDENTYQVRDLTVLTTEQGLPANKISDLGFDLEGGIWVCCSNGLVVLKHNPAKRNYGMCIQSERNRIFNYRPRLLLPGTGREICGWPRLTG